MVSNLPIHPPQGGIHIRLFREVGPYRFLFTSTIIAGFLSSLFGFGGAWSLSKIVGGIFLYHKSVIEARWLIIGLLALVLSRGLLVWVSESKASKLANKIKSGLRERLYARILSLGPAFTKETETGSLINLLVDGIEALDAFYCQYLPQVFFAILTPLAILGIVFPIDPLSGLVLLLTSPIIPVFMVLIANVSANLTQKQWNTLSRMSAYFLDVLQGLTTLKILGRSKDQTRIVAQVSDRFREITMNVLKVTFLSALVMELTSTLCTAIIAVEIGLRLLYGRIAFEQAFFVLILTPEFYMPLRLLGLRFHSGMAGVSSAKQIFEILDKPLHPISLHTRNKFDERKVWSTLNSIRFKNVSFTYIKNQPVLDNISFEIKPGQKIALVGPSGAGKSTIANLLLRFYTPDQGDIVFNDENLLEIPIDEWLHMVSWVPQRPYLFADTVAANIRLARPEASNEEVKVAAQLAHADEFIQELPDGYETQIGERGMRLSAGQAQRIALARAFLKDAPLLILDEPTSNLDPELEALLQDSLLRLMNGRMVLLIAHRMSTVFQADTILVVDQGKIVERGNHLELMKKEGLYFRLVKGSEIKGYEKGINPGCSQNETTMHNQLSSTTTPDDPLPNLTLRRTWARRNEIKTLFQLISLLSPFKNWVFLSILLGFLTIACGIGLMSTSTYIISIAALHPSIAVLQVAIVGVRFFGISRACFRYLERITSHQVTFKLLAQLRVWFYQAIEPLAPARLFEAHSGDLLSRIIGDVAALENFYVRGAVPPVVALFISFCMVLLMNQINPWLSLVFVIFMTLGGIVLPIWTWKTGKGTGAMVTRLRSKLSVALVDGVQGLSDITVFQALQRSLQKVQSKNHALNLAQEKSGHLSSLQNAILITNANLALWSVLILGAWLIQHGQINAVLLGVICISVISSFEAVQILPQAAVNLGKDLEAAQRLMVVVQADPATKKQFEGLPKPDTFRLEVEGVNFAYPITSSLYSIGPLNRNAHEVQRGNASPRVLTNISFTLSPGQHIAIVGPSGSGKSTLVNLLLRFWDYQAGQICLGGHDIRLYDPEDLHCWFNVVPQNTYLFSGTIRENLLLAQPRASLSEIEHAVQQAQLQEFIETLPQGYQTWIGEGGLRLSAGERQRLALARAFLRDSPVLILDEATANLDTVLEQKILAEIRRKFHSCARLTITHRLVGLEDADEILVVQRGSVIERGPHAKLIQQQGFYRKIWDLQNQALDDE